MNKLPACPECKENYSYEDDDKLVCPMCGHEWTENDDKLEIRDSNNNVLNDNDSVVVIQDLKIKGTSTTIKIGTKVKNIRLDYHSSDDHDINCKIDGIGAIKLKSSVVKKK